MKKSILALLPLLAIISMPGMVAPSGHTRVIEAGAGITQTVANGAQAPSSAHARSRLRLESMFITRETGGSLFENVVAVLKNKYYDSDFRSEVLPQLASQYANRSGQATTLRAQRQVVHDFLSRIPASHLGLLSMTTHRYIFNDLTGRPYPTFGFQLVNLNEKYYAFAVLEGGPAERAGLLSTDHIVSIDGLTVEKSPRLEWRSDDAYIADDRDPPVHYLTAEQGDAIKLRVERNRGRFIELTIRAESYSAFDAARASARVLSEGGLRIGYLHFWYIHMTGVPELLEEKLEGQFKDCSAVILDLRGRGGNGMAVSKIIEILREERSRPVVALVDRQSRSAKDVLAFELKRTGLARLVGEPTAGAVIPASFADVGHDTVLMFPSFKLAKYTDILEFKPVEPDVLVKRAGPMSAGADPILNAGRSEAVRLVKASAKVAASLKLGSQSYVQSGFKAGSKASDQASVAAPPRDGAERLCLSGWTASFTFRGSAAGWGGKALPFRCTFQFQFGAEPRTTPLIH